MRTPQFYDLLDKELNAIYFLMSNFPKTKISYLMKVLRIEK